MGERVRSQTLGAVCLIEMDNGPDNILSGDLCLELAKHLTRAFQDTDIRVVLWTSAGPHFSAGYDLGSLSSDLERAPLFDLVDLLATAPKPVIAGLRGNSLGGGLELALLCAFRLAAPNVVLGFPDIKHDLVPGAGATQSLPRILGAKASLRLLTSGKVVGAEAFNEAIDAKIQGDFLTGALRFAKALADQNITAFAISDRTDGFGDPGVYQTALIDARQGLMAKSAALADIVTCIESALLLPFSAGLKFEREMFKVAEARDGGRAKRHLVHQTGRIVRKNYLLAKPAAALRKIAIVGLSETSFVLAARLLLGGLQVTALRGQEFSAEDLRFEIMDAARQQAQNRGRKPPQEARLSEMLTIADALEECRAADLVIEAGDEPYAGIRERLSELGQIMSGDVMFVRVTSRLEENIWADFAHKSRAATIWVADDFKIRTCEYHLAQTDGGVAQPAVLRLLHHLGLIGVENKLQAGAATAALAYAMIGAAETLCISGTPLSAIDKAMSDFGMELGPFRLADRLGPDRILMQKAMLPATLQSELTLTQAWLHPKREEGEETPPARPEGSDGFYLNVGGLSGVPNPDVTHVVQDLRDGRGEKAAPETIQQTALAALANMGAALIDNEAVQNPGALDLLARTHLGFLPDTGGPMHAADTAGLLHLRYALGKTTEGINKDAHPYLLDMVKKGLKFEVLNKA